jgi:hypothetical protein
MFNLQTQDELNLYSSLATAWNLTLLAECFSR